MKNTIKFLIVLGGLFIGFYQPTQAQTQCHNFYLKNGKIFWQKVFPTKLNFEQLVAQVKESGILKNPETVQGKIIGQSKFFDADYKGAGYSSASIPTQLIRFHFNGLVIIEYKKGKYRVTLKNIRLVDKFTNLYSVIGGYSFETMAYKSRKNEFRGWFTKSPSEIYDYTLSKLFNFKPVSLNNNW